MAVLFPAVCGTDPLGSPLHSLPGYSPIESISICTASLALAAIDVTSENGRSPDIPGSDCESDRCPRWDGPVVIHNVEDGDDLRWMGASTAKDITSVCFDL
jgi:hypothetical protein